MIPTVVAAYLEHTPQVFLWVVLIYSSASLFGVLVLMGVQASLLKSQRRDEFELRTKPTVTPNVYMVNNHEPSQPRTTIKMSSNKGSARIKTVLRISIKSTLLTEYYEATEPQARWLYTNCYRHFNAGFHKFYRMFSRFSRGTLKFRVRLISK